MRRFEKLLPRAPYPLIILLLLSIPSLAQEKSNGIKWQDGPTVGRLGDLAELTVPKGYRFTGKEGTLRVLEITQNPSSGNELGAVIPVTEKADDEIWFVIFEFDDSGYVRDNEKDSLDAKAILESIEKATEESNKVREQKGWPPFHVIGWSHEPYYDSRTHNLTWSILGEGEAQGKPAAQSVNYSVRLLGRRGIMKADLVLSPGLVPKVVPEFEDLLGGFSFIPGQTYSDWRSGDKVAKYGLTALIVGGVATAALKTGLLAKFWKLIVAGLVALGAFLKRLFIYFKRLLSGKAAEESPQHE
ncbi:MAG TPA: DUF2167 domain-containing protein [Candidatus Sulfotelmatobacter sp.]|nr:DUF2167 domain-containing protein [Candidatus Sulfotelmatobacter sp.]